MVKFAGLAPSVFLTITHTLATGWPEKAQKPNDWWQDDELLASSSSIFSLLASCCSQGHWKCLLNKNHTLMMMMMMMISIGWARSVFFTLGKTPSLHGAITLYYWLSCICSVPTSSPPTTYYCNRPSCPPNPGLGYYMSTLYATLPISSSRPMHLSQVKAKGDLFHWAWILTAQRMLFVVVLIPAHPIPQCRETYPSLINPETICKCNI